MTVQRGSLDGYFAMGGEADGSASVSIKVDVDAVVLPESFMLRRYSNIGMVSDLLDEEKHTIRLWESTLGIRTKRVGNRRMFSHSDIKKLVVTKVLTREWGIALSGAARMVRASRWRDGLKGTRVIKNG